MIPADSPRLTVVTGMPDAVRPDDISFATSGLIDLFVDEIGTLFFIGVGACPTGELVMMELLLLTVPDETGAIGGVIGKMFLREGEGATSIEELFWTTLLLLEGDGADWDWLLGSNWSLARATEMDKCFLPELLENGDLLIDGLRCRKSKLF